MTVLEKLLSSTIDTAIDSKGQWQLIDNVAALNARTPVTELFQRNATQRSRVASMSAFP